MGNILCCLGSRENPPDDIKNTPINIAIKKEEITYIKSKNKNLKKNLTNNSLETNGDNNKNDLDIITSEIQEKLFTTKDEIYKDSFEKNGNNFTKQTADTELKKSILMNDDTVIKSKNKNVNKNSKNENENENNLNTTKERNKNPITRQNSTNSQIIQTRKSFIGGPLKLKNHKKDVEYLSIEIFIDHLDLNGFDTEIYGPYFQPYLDITFNNEKSKLIKANGDLTENSRNDSINFSNLSNIDISVSNNISNNGSFIMNSSKLGNVYHYKTLRKFYIEKKKLENYDINIEFNLRNNCKFKNSNLTNTNYKETSFNLGQATNNSNLNISGISNNNNNSFNLNSSVVTGDNIPVVLIGSNYINLNKFYSELNKKFYDCFLELKLRKTLSIGYLKLVFFIEEIDKFTAFNNNNLLNEEEGNVINTEFSEWIEKNRLDENENNLNNNKLINMDNFNLWENNLVNMSDLPDLVCEDFFNTDFNFLNEEENINFKNNKIRNKTEDNTSKNSNLQNSFINLNLNSQSEFKIIGINKKNYKKNNKDDISERDSKKNKYSNNRTEIKEEENLRIIDRMKVTDILIKNKSYILANEMKANINNLKIDEELLRDIFVEEITSKITFNNNGIYHINENYRNKEKIDLTKYSMYQFLLILNNLTLLEKYDILTRFFNILNEEEKVLLFQITIFDRFNIYIFRNFLSLMSNYIMFFKNNLDDNLRYKVNIDQRTLTKTVFAIIENIKNIEFNEKEIWERYVFEIKDCLIYALNLLWDLCHEPLENNNRKDTRKDSSNNDNSKNKLKINELTSIYANCLYTLTFRNRLVFLLKPFLNHSEIIGIIYKIFRKCFQNLTNTTFTKLIDISQFNEFPEKIADGLIESLINGDNKNSFIKYMEIIILKYTHYPDVVKNCYSIFLCLLKRTNEEHLGKFLIIFDLKKFQNSFEIYKFKLRASSKEINLFFINILYILVSFYQKKSVRDKLIDEEENEDSYENNKNLSNKNTQIDYVFRDKYFKVLDILANIFSSFFDTTNRRYIDFVKKKFLDLQLQDLLLKIGSILFIYESNVEIILQSDFMNNLVRYLLEFSFGKCEFKSVDKQNILNNQEKQLFNFINFINEKKIRNLETIKKFVSSIILSAFEIYRGLLQHDNKYFADVAMNLTKYNIDESDKLIKLFEYCLDPMDRYNINIFSHKKILKDIVDSFENQDEEEDEGEENN